MRPPSLAQRDLGDRGRAARCSGAARGTRASAESPPVDVSLAGAGRRVAAKFIVPRSRVLRTARTASNLNGLVQRSIPLPRLADLKRPRWSSRSRRGSSARRRILCLRPARSPTAAREPRDSGAWRSYSQQQPGSPGPWWSRPLWETTHILRYRDEPIVNKPNAAKPSASAVRRMRPNGCARIAYTASFSPDACSSSNVNAA